MDTLLEAVLDSPLLPRHAERINRALAEERARRERFYEEITEDDKWEFINGQIFMHSPAKWCHTETVSLLARLLGAYADRHALGTVVTEHAMISLTRNDYEPDICFFQWEVANTFTPDQMRFPAPALIVEILSLSTARNDHGVKKGDYAAHGVAEYWIVDPIARTIETYRLRHEDYELAGTLHDDDPLASVALPGFRVPVRALFDQAANVVALTALLTALPPAS